MAVNFLYGSTGGKKEQDNRSVYIRVNYNTLNWKKSLSMSISKSEWDFKKKSIVNLYTGVRSAERSEYLQEVLDKMTDLEKKFTQYLRELKTSGRFATIDLNEFRNECEAIFNGETNRTKEDRVYLTDLIKEFIEEKEVNKESDNTIRSWKSRLNTIKDFEQTQKKRFYTDEIDKSYYLKFRKWCNSKGYKENSFGGFIRIIKSTLNQYQTEVSVNLEYKKFTDVKVPVHKVVLNEEEMQKIFNYEGSERLENVRDIVKVLYFGCMRYSDMAKTLSIPAEKMNITKTGDEMVWEVYQPKTRLRGHLKKIPMHQELIEMHKSNNFPRVISNPKLNEYLTELCSEVGIKKDVKSHDFRRSYVTNEIGKGTNPKKVRAVSGHANWNSFDTYCKDNNINWQ